MRIWAALLVVGVFVAGCSDEGPSAEELAFINDVAEALPEEGFDEDASQLGCFAGKLVAAFGYGYIEEQGVTPSELARLSADDLDTSLAQANDIAAAFRECDLYASLASGLLDFDDGGIVVRDEVVDCFAEEFRADEDRDSLLARLIVLRSDEEPREIDSGTMTDILIDCGFTTDAFFAGTPWVLTNPELRCVDRDVAADRETKDAVMEDNTDALGEVFLEALEECLTPERQAEVFSVG